MESESEKSAESNSVDANATSNIKEPYVGMRPYTEEEKEVFYGRDQVALRLRNKIYSNRLTILYASSGVGKTSILQTLVEPELRSLDAYVVHFDRWSGEEPLTVLIHAIEHSLREYNIDDEANEENSLLTLTKFINEHQQKSFVLILDQFEEFLRKHGQRMDPIRSEIAELQRNTSLQIHIVLSLRQEFLTGLEPFREVIFNLFQSTYQLKDLNEDEIREAITLPVEKFGFSYEDALIDKLIEDLGVGKISDKFQSREGNIDLPPLQQVLLELWRFTKSSNQKVITLALYNQLGGAQKILDEYINKVMPTRWLHKLFVAKLMRSLAPPSGLKQSFTPADLCLAVGLSETKSTKVKDELDFLTNKKILRTRKFSTSDEISYELQHDAFVAIISRWRNLVFDRLKSIKRYSRAVVILAIILCIPTFKYIIDKRDMKMNTESLLAGYEKGSQLSHESGYYSRLEHATEYILSLKDSVQYFEKLKSILDNDQVNIPDTYGLNKDSLNNIPPTDDDWPVSLIYSVARPLNKSIFNSKWKEVSNEFAKKWGIPLPTRLHLKTGEYLDTERLKLRLRYKYKTNLKGLWAYFARFDLDKSKYKYKKKTIDLDLPSNESFAFISEKDLSAKPKRFLNFFKHEEKEWIQLKKAPPLGPWWAVPRWSMPVWKVSGKNAIDGSAFLASLLALEIKKRPEYLLHPAATELLLQKVKKKLPNTVNEARKARGKKLHKDLIEVVRNESSLLHLPLILDALAHYPKMSSRSAVKHVLLDIKSSIINSKLKLHGPWRKRKSEKDDDDKWVTPYREVETLLPEYKSPIRIYLGNELARIIYSDDSKSGDLKEAEIKSEDYMIKKFGLKIPVASYKAVKNKEAVGDYSFRIEVLNKESQYDEVKTHKTNEERVIKDVISEYEKLAYDYRIFWITADSTNTLLKNLPGKLSKWLKKHYSLTDIKLIFRAIINPTLKEVIKPLNGENKRYNIPAENTLYHLEWMLKTIPFWGEVDGHLNLEKLVMNLRSLQNHRFEGLEADDMEITDNVSISKGIEHLQKNKYSDAAKEFATAIKNNNKDAVKIFLVKYVDKFEGKLESRLLTLCKDPTKGLASRSDRVILKDYISKKTGLPSDKKRRMKLCLLADYPSTYKQDKQDIIKELSESYSNPETWRVKEAAWFSRILFEKFDPVQDSDEDKTLIKSFFESSYLRKKDKGLGLKYRKRKSYRQFNKLVDDCYSSDKANWCKSWIKELALKSNDYQEIFRLAYYLSKSEKIDELKLSLSLIKKVFRNIEGSEKRKKYKDYYQNYAKLIKATALYRLETHKDKPDFKQSEDILEALIKTKYNNKRAYEVLLGLKLNKGEYTEAIKLSKKVLRKWPKDMGFSHTYLLSNILTSDTDTVIEIANEITNKINPSKEALYVGTLGRMITGSGNWQRIGKGFASSKHKYANYIMMMMYANSVGKEKENAEKLLKKRWNDIYKDNWQEQLPGRFKAGDKMAWREMLVGYYQGVVTKNEIFEPLQSDEQFNKSNYIYTDFSRKAMLTEAYFYDAMLNKAKGNIEGMKKRLQQVVDVDYRIYSEYAFSRYLLASLEKEQGK